jgi:hypothetical protein
VLLPKKKTRYLLQSSQQKKKNELWLKQHLGYREQEQSLVFLLNISEAA